MARNKATGQPFNIMIVGQAGRLQYEAVLFLASLRENSPNFRGKVIVQNPSRGLCGKKTRECQAKFVMF